ncbi:MAG: hypothetical protein ACLPWG_04650 [Steroidobacteraceae bacterium]
MRYSIKGISYLEEVAKDRLQKADFAEVQRLMALSQLIRYGVCTCHCHFSSSVYHSADPCCGNAKLIEKK